MKPSGAPILRSTLRLRAASLLRSPIEPGEKGIFLTGATGNLGSHVLAITPRNEPIYCQVRGVTSVEAAMERLRKAAKSNNLPWDSENIVPAITAPMPRVRAIWHLAASTNVFSSLNTLERTNIAWVRSLAAHPNFTLASSLSVFTATDLTPGVCSESDDLSTDCNVFGGYPQSKTASEFAAPGATIVRFSLLVPEVMGDRHVKSMFDAALRKLEVVPHLAYPDMAVDMVTVKTAAAEFVRVAGTGGTHHCSAEHHITVSDYVRGIPIVSDKAFADRLGILTRLERKLIRHSFYGESSPLEFFEAGRGWSF